MTEAENAEYSLEEQILDTIETGNSIGHSTTYPDDIISGNQVTDVLDKAGYVNLGWLNSGIKIPDGVTFRQVYANWSGSFCINVDSFKRYYCVDMGD